MIKLRKPAAMIAAASLSLTLMGGMVTSGAACKSPRFGNMMSKSQEIDLGRQARQEIEQKERILRSGPQYDRLQRVASRIIPLAQADWDVPYTVELIDSDEINAFAVPGGPIYFYRGLMELADSDDEVASVLGHEAIHIVKRHSAKQISDAQGKGAVASILLGRSGKVVQTLAGIGLQIDQLRFSRDDEAQADELGFQYLVRAGYNPYAMASFFKKMGAKGGGGGPEWLRSHPVTSSRIQKAEERAAEYSKSHPGR